MNSVLNLKLEHSKPVELVDLSLALLAVGGEFSRFNQLSRRGEPNAKLYLQQVQKGSIVAELVAVAAQGNIVFDNIDTLKLFVDHVINLLRFLLGDAEKPENIDKRQLEQMDLFLEPVAKDSGGSWTISHNGQVNITVNYLQANAAQNTIKREKLLLTEPVSGLHTQVVLVFKQTRDDHEVGNRSVIESISHTIVKTVFADRAIHDAMLMAEKNPLVGGFLVDVHVETINDKPSLYKIMRFYEKIEIDQ